MFGVVISVATDDATALGDLARFISDTFPESAMRQPAGEAEFDYVLLRYPGRKDTLIRNGKVILFRNGRTAVWKYLVTQIRSLISEYARERVFVHAGVVAWKGAAIVIPGHSLQGKTTLTAELVKIGAVYYSDEFAVFDQDGMVHPCPKPLSIRPMPGKFYQLDTSVSALGGIAGSLPVPVGLVLVTSFEKDAKWQPRRLTPAQGVIELVRNTIPIRRAPKFTMQVLTKAATFAATVKSKRGEASECAPRVIELLESLMMDKHLA